MCSAFNTRMYHWNWTSTLHFHGKKPNTKMIDGGRLNQNKIDMLWRSGSAFIRTSKND